MFPPLATLAWIHENREPMDKPFKTPDHPNAIHSIRFEASKVGLQTAARESVMMEDAENSAKAWIFSHQDAIEVVSISSALGVMSAMVTVWYRS